MAKVGVCPKCGYPWNPEQPGGAYCPCCWWPPAQCVFARKQMMFLVFWHATTGLWPQEPNTVFLRATASGNRRIRARASFELVADFNAELVARLETTGEAGEALAGELSRVAIFKALFTGQSSRVYPESEYYLTLSPPAQRALDYVTGWRRRSMRYPKWSWQVKARGWAQGGKIQGLEKAPETGIDGA